MQTAPEEWPSMTRMLSCRHSRKVSCESLSQSDVHLQSNPQFESESFYYSDDEKEHMQHESATGHDEANELENPSYGYLNLANGYLQRARELEKRSTKLDNFSYGDGKAARHNFLTRLFSKVSHAPVASRAKEVERLRKHCQANPSVIRRTGGVLSHSGPILLPIGSHHGPANSKAPGSLRSSSIIPHNAVAGKMTSAGAGEPFSPKVTCLGRVRNKQKHLDKCTSVTSNDPEGNQLDFCCMLVPKGREKKKADTEVVVSASKKDKKTSGMGSGDAMVKNHRSKETDGGKTLRKLAVQNSGGKGTMSSRFIAKEEGKRWSFRETPKHEESKLSHQHQRNWQATEALAVGASSSEYSMDLSRFGARNQRGHEMMVASSVGNGSQRFKQDNKEENMHAPPQNALLLIRNRKTNDDPKVASSAEVTAAESSDGEETTHPMALGHQEKNHFTGTQSNLFMSRLHVYNEDLPALPDAEMGKPVTIADILRHTSCLMTEGTSATVFKNKKRHTEHSDVHRDASPLPKPSLEVSIWQRRAIEKPCALDIKKCLKAGFNQPTSICVNKS